MPRRLDIWRAVVKPGQEDRYLAAVEVYRRAAEKTGCHFWLYSVDGESRTYIEFSEGTSPADLASLEDIARQLDPTREGMLGATCVRRERLAACTEVVPDPEV